MVRCEKCGAELLEDAAFCQHCGAPVTNTTSFSGSKVIDLASWGDRIIAFIIDMILVGIVIGVLKAIIILPSFFIGGYVGIPRYIPWSDFGFDNLFQFIYFAFMDYEYGQSIGKMVMKIRVTNLEGGAIDITQSLIQAFGKAFLLPLDLIIGWLFLGEKSQRLFTMLAKTIVTKEKNRY
ncbi:RDD family protein [Candidatus Bathyarchaeota archaeon]|nr:RDD family protein [Candidatus Bathyarchaeota archaeon]